MRKPDKQFKNIKAWKARRLPSRAEQWASLSQWVVNGPFHPVWDWWMIGVIHLREMEGQDTPPRKRYPEAEYEFMIVSLDPDCYPPDFDGEDDRDIKFLVPLDVTLHFHGVSDEQAASLGEWAVERIVQGQMSPDSDFRRAWLSALDRRVTEMKETDRSGSGRG